MRTRTRWIVALAAIGCVAVGSEAVSGASSSSARSASGRGTMAFGEHDMDGGGNGRGMMVFEVTSRKGGSGSLLFAAEHAHHASMYPDVVVEVDEFDDVSFTATTVTFSGSGTYHKEPAYVRATAADGASGEGHDHFKIIVTRPSGELIFEAAGELFLGDIRIE